LVNNVNNKTEIYLSLRKFYKERNFLSLLNQK